MILRNDLIVFSQLRFETIREVPEAHSSLRLGYTQFADKFFELFIVLAPHFSDSEGHCYLRVETIQDQVFDELMYLAKEGTRLNDESYWEGVTVAMDKIFLKFAQAYGPRSSSDAA